MKKKRLLIVLLSLALTLPMFASEPLAPLFRQCYKSKQTSFKMSLGPISTGFFKLFSKEFREIGIRSISIAVFEDVEGITESNKSLKKLRKQSVFSDFSLLSLIKDEETVVKIFGKEEEGFIKNLYLVVFDEGDKDIVLLHLKGKISPENIAKITTSTKNKYGH